MPLKYKCLMLDHDDTAVKSTPAIHYPSFVEAMKTLRPHQEPLSLEAFVSYCFKPGFSALCTDIMQFSQEEQARQYAIWRRHTVSQVPDFYPGFPELIREFKERGGIIGVVSHSESDQILRDYQQHSVAAPDRVFGWELEEAQRKPNPYPLEEMMRAFQLEPNEMLIVDDLKPGLDMARSCGVDFAGAGWSHIIPEIADYMRKYSDYYFPTVEAFSEFLFND